MERVPIHKGQQIIIVKMVITSNEWFTAKLTTEFFASLNPKWNHQRFRKTEAIHSKQQTLGISIPEFK